ncbi:hypothetical protein JCM7686_0536 [Paracoccus aminophilus JCM 7686]|uniref:Uncharacterized protein n=1 Tax=Paracoccus aminophilus JCM 7686 TaxID=1367847 RepID=S5XW83_PARAH|nr:hypothetical protein JCM7686_0536 [Paracoccus aminophilus JCM 7686]
MFRRMGQKLWTTQERPAPQSKAQRSVRAARGSVGFGDRDGRVLALIAEKIAHIPAKAGQSTPLSPIQASFCPSGNRRRFQRLTWDLGPRQSRSLPDRLAVIRHSVWFESIAVWILLVPQPDGMKHSREQSRGFHFPDRPTDQVVSPVGRRVSQA